MDRDLLSLCGAAAAAPLVVAAGATGVDWLALGAAGVLPEDFQRQDLVAALDSHAVVVDTAAPAVSVDRVSDEGATGGGALLVAVCGSGGVGASTVAMATAQGLARARPQDEVLLVDLALRAELAVLHDVGDVVPGIQELIDLHRLRDAGREEVRALTWDVVDRGYRLLLGLRRPTAWTTLRPTAFRAAFASLSVQFDAVVCDLTADFESETDTGSADIGDRTLMARTAVTSADVVLAVGATGTKGVHSLVRLLGDLAVVGVPAGRVVPVLNQAPRSPVARAVLTRTIAELSAPVMARGRTSSPVYLPTRRVDDAIRDVTAMPGPLPELLAGAVLAVVARLGVHESGRGWVDAPVPVRPGSVGTYAGEST